MKNAPEFKTTLLLLAIALSLNACAGNPVDAEINAPVSAADASLPATESGPLISTETQAARLTPTVQAERSLPANLDEITAENAGEIDMLLDLQPDFPDYYLVSADGRIGARADLQGIDVLEIGTGRLLTHIAVELPDCDYGLDRYFSFNRDGSFLAVAARDAIQVWQMGGGLIYESPYSRQFSTDTYTCGAEIPQLALSPDASLLAISAVAYSSTSAQAYFRVVQTLQNQVLYEWDGAADSLHGNLYTFRGLGFSTDGTLLQTFDPARYSAFSGDEYQSFRFWSVGSWQELDRGLDVVRNGFDQDDLLYALQTDEEIQLKSRVDGVRLASLSETGCTQANPCDVLWSPQAKTAALLNTAEASLQYHRELIATQMTIWDWQNDKELEQAAVFTRNLDGIALADAGSYISVGDIDGTDTDEPDWWTSPYNFAGLQAASGSVYFMPQVLSLTAGSDCDFCGTCYLDPQSVTLTCSQDYRSVAGNLVRMMQEGDRFILQVVDDKSSQADFSLDLPASYKPGWDLRLLAYSDEYRTAFYCLDNEARPQTCAIYAAGMQNNLTEVEDIYALRFSADGRTAAYINRDEKALFLLNLQTGKLTRMAAYQSRAWLVNPAFSSEGSELVYLIQNLKDATVLSLEWVDAGETKVLRRSTLDNNQISQPTTLALGTGNGLLAIGNQDGWVYVLDQEKGNIIYSWQASEDVIIGLTFVTGDKLLISLDEKGVIQIWGIQ